MYSITGGSDLCDLQRLGIPCVSEIISNLILSCKFDFSMNWKSIEWGLQTYISLIS